MSNYPVGRRPRSADPHSKLRLAALTAVVAGVVLLAAAAFVLSYSGIHQVALQAGVSHSLAKLYPVIFDAMLVIAGAAAMALRGAGWWSRFYAWACLILLLAAVAIGDAVHATNTALPERASRAAVAITPWVLLLLAFGLLLTMLRHFRKARAAAAARQAALAAAGGTGDAAGPGAGRAAVTWAGTAGSAAAAAAEGRTSLVKLLEPRTGEPPAVEVPYEAGGADAAIGAGLHDPVSYGEETGYVHPDSYRDEGEYSPHGDSGGPEAYAAAGGHGLATENGLTGENGLAGDGGQADQMPAGQKPANGEAANGEPRAAQPGQAGATAEPGQAGATMEPGQDGDGSEDGAASGPLASGPPASEGRGLERMWSTPTRPEE